jgi:hypothetical protein
MFSYIHLVAEQDVVSQVSWGVDGGSRLSAGKVCFSNYIGVSVPNGYSVKFIWSSTFEAFKLVWRKEA